MQVPAFPSAVHSVTEIFPLRALFPSKPSTTKGGEPDECIIENCEDSSSAQPPPLDCVTIGSSRSASTAAASWTAAVGGAAMMYGEPNGCGGGAVVDDDNVSCLSFNDDENDEDRPPRSLFGRYWAQSGETPRLRQTRLPVSIATTAKASSTTTTTTTGTTTRSSAHHHNNNNHNKNRNNNNTYEQALHIQEQEVSLRRCPRRRRIFGGHDSAPELGGRPKLLLDSDGSGRQASDLRKTCSTSALSSPRSILRNSSSVIMDSTTTTASSSSSSNFSDGRHGCAASHSERSSSVVTFSASVKVVVFESPAERYAPSGWSRYFH